ncbi:MAG TPA: hypothetical protein VHA33_12270 [Candidatus Angelobacter sp.]|jgi:ElaB/YqjD/DUF883 family membrane-anchored ribosome-binding protein|nr:hypothetical protein [Candidatus Angelobacter sp.]
MTETLHKSSDVPCFDSDPSNQPRVAGPVLVQRAQQIGAALGRSVRNVREAQARLREISNQTAESFVARTNDLVRTLKAKSQEVSQEVSTRAAELSDAMIQKSQRLTEKTKEGYSQARLRANQLTRDYPVHTIAIAGAMGLVLGIGIRVWRANRA